MKCIRNKMAIRLKGDELALGGSTLRTAELIVREEQSTQVSTNTEVTDVDIRM